MPVELLMLLWLLSWLSIAYTSLNIQRGKILLTLTSSTQVAVDNIQSSKTFFIFTFFLNFNSLNNNLKVLGSQRIAKTPLENLASAMSF